MSEWNNIQFQAPAGERVGYGFFGVTVMDGPSRWWAEDSRRWVDHTGVDECISSHAPCRSLRAFRRHLKRHSASLAGCKVVLVSRWKGCDVFAQITAAGRDRTAKARIRQTAEHG